MDAEKDTFVLRPAPLFGVGIGIFVMLAIALPGLIFDTAHFLATSGIPILLFCGTCIAALVWFARSHIRIERDVAARVLRITKVRAPLAPVTTTIQLDSIASVDLETSSRNAARVVIVMQTSERIPLTGGMTSTDDHDRAAEVIREWIAA